MLLVLALGSEPRQVYPRALRRFSVEEIGEAFAATRGLTMPSQLRGMLHARGRDLQAEFLELLPEPPGRSLSSASAHGALGLTLAVLVGAFLAVGFVISNLNGLGLIPG
jgi:hypothetical protein